MRDDLKAEDEIRVPYGCILILIINFYLKKKFKKGVDSAILIFYETSPLTGGSFLLEQSKVQILPTT